ncbi:hypothetical protein Tcan_06363 [Toxocara canis]|uniref:Uncharacterized protein n=1 Tax=Toxocara canis TaxID=6265 RepID=A0A0B2VVT4_TOXCA|nr:hypothetical protein Tcan_06363 [Toxocara canis]
MAARAICCVRANATMCVRCVNQIGKNEIFEKEQKLLAVKLQSDYEYVGETPVVVPEAMRMPMSDISEQQRAELSMIAANSEPFFSRPIIVPITAPLPSIWSRSWPRAIIMSTVPPTTASVEPAVAKSSLLSVLGGGAENAPEKSLASLMKSLPDPSVLLSVEKLFSSFKKSGGDGEVEAARTPDGSQLKTVTPSIEFFETKSKNGSRGEKASTEVELGVGSLLGRGEVGGISNEKVTTGSMTPQPLNKSDAGDNLLGSLLQGRLGEIDWIESFFGTKQTPSKEEGNAIAQIFKGGFFGPANDDVRRKTPASQ